LRGGRPLNWSNTMTTTTTKERPILFSGPMVRAILNEASPKTQTRRIVKPTMTTPKVAPLAMFPWMINGEQVEDDDGTPMWVGQHPDYPGEGKWFTCPYGQPGDQLWVRETWALVDGELWFAADCDMPREDGVKFKPSIHMPRAYSRISLEITGVRVERLQDISDRDAQAEGVQAAVVAGYPVAARSGFHQLWNHINGKTAPWESNPWVWVIGFKRI
jgi:hypothetical protein